MDRLYLAAIQMLPGIGPVRLKLLLDYFGSAVNVWQADRFDLMSSQIVKCDVIEQIIKSDYPFDSETSLHMEHMFVKI